MYYEDKMSQKFRQQKEDNFKQINLHKIAVIKKQKYSICLKKSTGWVPQNKPQRLHCFGTPPSVF